MLLTIIGHGGQAMREEAGRAVLALKGDAFAESVVAVGSESQAEGWYSLDHANRGGWTIDEMKQLVERVPEVPDALLHQYIGAFSRDDSFEVVRPRLTELLQQRLRAAEGTSVPDQKQIDRLKRLIEILPTDLRP